MTLLIDPPILFASFYAIGRRIDNPTVASASGLTLAGVFLVGSAGMYQEKEFMRPTWEIFGARTGRDFMLNSGVFSFDHEKRSRTRSLVVATMFASYPLWALAGLRLGRRKRLQSSRLGRRRSARACLL